MLQSRELVRIATDIAGHWWFTKHRSAICREYALVRAFADQTGGAWRLAPTGSALRPLPDAAATAPARVQELFPGIHALAKKRKLELCVNPTASLTAEPMRWTTDEVDELFSTLSSRGFQLPSLARLLEDVLAVATGSPFASDHANPHEDATGPHLRRALREALMDVGPPLAPTESLRAILSHARHDLFLPLPKSVEHRRLLQALASSRAHALPVRREWLSASDTESLDDTPHKRVSTDDLSALLGALEPMIKAGDQSDLADQAAATALEFLRHHENLSELLHLDNFADFAILRGRDPRTDEQLVLSLADLLDRSAKGFLLSEYSPDTHHLPRALARALPDAPLVVVGGKTAALLNEGTDASLKLRPADKSACFDLINGASGFGDEASRAELIEALQVADGDDKIALRKLCAGDTNAAFPGARLQVLAPLDEISPEIERITIRCMARESAFLVPVRIANALAPRQLVIIGVSTLALPQIEALFRHNADVLLKSKLTQAECDSILQMGFSSETLRTLPIHVRSNGSIGDADGVFHEVDWPIPESLKEHVSTVEFSDHPEARRAQERIIPRWTPQTQIDQVLFLPEPHIFQAEVLEALETFAPDDRTDAHGLSTTGWLTVDGEPIAACDLLNLPPDVEEAARGVLSSSGESLPFFTANDLPADVRRHAGFRYVERWLQPCQDMSLRHLVRIVKTANVAGRLGSAGNRPDGAFLALAETNADLKLPGWRLLAALLTHNRQDFETVWTSFSELSEREHDTAGRHLDALAEMAVSKGPAHSEAERAYEYGFAAIAKWSDEARRRVFALTRVPTADGQWRSGREVVAESSGGVAAAHVLAEAYASKLSASETARASIGEPNGDATAETDSATSVVDLPKLEADSVARHRAFLEPWRGRIPSDLVIVYLGLIGRYEAMREYAMEWESDAMTTVDASWKKIDERMRPSLNPGSPAPNPLCERVNHRRFRINAVEDRLVPVVALSGDQFNAPVDDSFVLLVGNSHKKKQRVITSHEDSRRRLVIDLHVRSLDLSTRPQSEIGRAFRGFVETVATDCLPLAMTDQRRALEEILDKAMDIDQAMLEETGHVLRDRLPAILAELKPAVGSACHAALRKYHADEQHHHRVSNPADKLVQLKTELWRSLCAPETGDELLSTVRTKIAELGYSARNVLFELFQNADDAYAQLENSGGNASFRVEILSDAPGGFRIVHWGRPINHLGPNVDEARRRGHDRDLVNMLLMNFSDKRPDENLTGKFGLGFKSVHVLSGSVGIASAFIALRMHGGFLPEEWREGIGEANALNDQAGRRATVIDVPFSADTTTDGERCVRAFRDAGMWLPVFARQIRRIEVTGIDPMIVDCAITALTEGGEIDAITIRSATTTSRALRFNLGDGYGLVLELDAHGPRAFAENIPRVWNLAPLTEKLTSGWLLNGPFPVDPGRGRLAGSDEDRAALINRLGKAFGARLMTLHDFASNEWTRLAETMGSEAEMHESGTEFWARLFDLMRLDLDDPLARRLHSNGGGYHRLAAERPVIPTGLARPFDDLVCASDVERRADGALTDERVLDKVRDWLMLSNLRHRLVHSNVAGVLGPLGFEGIRPITLSDLLRAEMGAERRIDPERARRLGKVITPTEIEKQPLHQERDRILATAKDAEFRAQDGSWRKVSTLNSVAAGREDEQRLCEFAPDCTLLHSDYQDAAVKFFEVARSRSGYGPNLRRLLEWAQQATDPARQRAVLQYLLDGHQSEKLADAMSRNPPAWLPKDPGEIPEDLLPNRQENKWVEDLLYTIRSRHVDSPSLPPPSPTALDEIYNWWLNARSVKQRAYDERVYPSSFRPTELQKGDDRTAWLTMFGLACSRSLGRTQDEQHRSFIDMGLKEGWWKELSESKPPDDVQPWIDRLERWSAADQAGQDFLPWRRMFGEIYTIVRWLDEYIEVFRKLPSILAEGPLSIDGDILRPSYSPRFRPLGIEAAPLDRSLHIGVSWLLRELARNEVYDETDAMRVAPYCWAPTQRARDYLQELGAGRPEDSNGIYKFIVEQIGDERARFCGDFDLPLQIHLVRPDQEGTLSW